MPCAVVLYNDFLSVVICINVLPCHNNLTFFIFNYLTPPVLCFTHFHAINCIRLFTFWNTSIPFGSTKSTISTDYITSTSTSILPLLHTKSHIIKRFQELRRRWQYKHASQHFFFH